MKLVKKNVLKSPFCDTILIMKWSKKNLLRELNKYFIYSEGVANRSKYSINLNVCRG